MRTLTAILIVILSALTLRANDHELPTQAPLIKGMDREAATAYCDSMPIRDPEGMYFWPEKGSVVLLRACRYKADTPVAYEIINLESPDILMPPGQVVGYLFSSSTAEDYHLYVYEHIDKEAVTSPRHMAATFEPMQQSFKFQGRKTSVSINPLSLIPHLRSLLRIKSENPVNDIPDGLRRIYPAPHPTPDNPSIPYPRYF